MTDDQIFCLGLSVVLVVVFAIMYFSDRRDR